MQRIKKGDTVVVISGKYLGYKGKVSEIMKKKNRIRIEGLHITRHYKRGAKKAFPDGGRIEILGSVPMSNVMPYSESAEKGVRPKVKELDTGKRIRTCPKTGHNLEK